MHKYVDVDDKKFQQFINREYREYTIPRRQKTLEEFCFPKKYELQIPQKFLAAFINPNTPYRGVLVYHRIGGGKSCAGINIAENFKGIMKIIFVMPAALKGNFRGELRSPCAGNNYLTDAERKKLATLDPTSKEYQDIIKKSDQRIDRYYQIYSFNKFIELIKNEEMDLTNTLLVIDEVQNMVSETGSYYKTLYDAIQAAPKSLRLVLMTATPIFDKPVEIALTMNLLLDKDHQLPTGRDFIDEFMDIKYTPQGPVYRVKNIDVFKNSIRGLVSYYRGAPPHVFPRTELYLTKIKMSETQRKLYRKIIVKESRERPVMDYVNHDISNSFFIGTRMVSNFVYPNNKTGEEGEASLDVSSLTLENLREYSPKFLRVYRKIRACKGTVFVYSSFLEYSGVKTFAKVLEHFGYRNYETDGPGKKRYAIWSGDQKPSVKDEIKAVFNNPNNEYGESIKVILGSPSIKEGVSLLRVQEVHILEPYWNESRLAQIIGRAVRFCSHKDVEAERQLVKVYIYMSVYPTIKPSVDEYIMKIAMDKLAVNAQFEKALREVAVDCTLFKNANVYPGEPDIVCDV